LAEAGVWEGDREGQGAEEQRDGVPVEREVVLIGVAEWSIMYRRGELPKFCQHEDGRIVRIHGREIPDDLAEGYLRKHPDATFVEEG
jgi:hypothetical protein